MARWEPKPWFSSTKALAVDFLYLRKQGMQLASKMRFISAQFDALLTGDLWLRNAEHSNRMAKLLERELNKIPEIKIAYPVEANGVFAGIPRRAHSQNQAAIFLLHVGRAAIDGALDVLVRYHGGRCSGVCGICGDGSLWALGAKATINDGCRSGIRRPRHCRDAAKPHLCTTLFGNRTYLAACFLTLLLLIK